MYAYRRIPVRKYSCTSLKIIIKFLLYLPFYDSVTPQKFSGSLLTWWISHWILPLEVNHWCCDLLWLQRIILHLFRGIHYSNWRIQWGVAYVEFISLQHGVGECMGGLQKFPIPTLYWPKSALGGNGEDTFGV